MRTKLLSIFLACFLFFGIFSGYLVGNAAFAASEVYAQFADETATDSSRKIASVDFKSGEEFEFAWDFVYDDLLFEYSSYLYNHDLAKMSFGLALACGNTPSSHYFWGEAGDNLGRQKNIEKLYKDLEFEDIRYYRYDVQLNDDASKIALSMARRDIQIDGDDFALVTVAIRGHGYGAEWGSNFDISKDRYSHKGFSDASLQIQETILEYFEEFEKVLDKKIKLWVVGYSRGANVANILGSDLDKLSKENVGIGRFFDPENIYVYTFASSRVVSSANNPDFHEDNISLFGNIFNILNPSDVLAIMVPAEWSFTRYGVDKVFLFGEHLNSFEENPLNYDIVDSIYKEMAGKDLFARDFSSYYLLLKDIENLMLILMPNAASYDDNYRELIMELGVLMSYHVPDDSKPGTWKSPSLKDKFLYRYGDRGRASYIRIDAYVSLLLFKMNPQLLLIRLPYEDIYSTAITFLALCDMYELKLQNVGEFIIEAIRTLLKHDLSLLSSIAIGHYPETYIAWLFSQDNPDLLFI